MDAIQGLVDQLMLSAGALWVLALFGQFFVMVCEAAKPKPEEGEDKSAPRGFALLVGILSLFTPLLLFFHAVLSGRGALIAAIVAIGGAIITASLIGWAIRALAPPVGRVLNSAAPVLALAVFALTVYVTWRTVFDFINTFISARAGAI